MKNENKDYFTLAHDVLLALKEGDFRLEQIPDRQARDKAGFLLQSQNFESEDSRYINIAKLVSKCLLRQLSDKEKRQIPENFDFAATRFQGGAYFYFTAPEGRMLDFDDALEKLETIKSLLCPKMLAQIPMSSFKEDFTRVCIGPISPEVELLVNNALADMIAFHGFRRPLEINEVPVQNGDLFFIFDKDDYAKALRNSEMLAACPIYQKVSNLVPQPGGAFGG